MSSAFPGSGAVTAPGAEAVDLAPAADPMTDVSSSFFPQMDQSQFDGLMGTDSGNVAPIQFANDQHASGAAGVITDFAKSLVGTPYVWGGTSTRGVDCSGLIQLAFEQAGIKLPRVSYQQANSGKAVALGNAQPGDLVWWDNSPRNHGADHISLYLGGGLIIEAPRPGVPVRIRKLGADEGAHVSRVL